MCGINGVYGPLNSDDQKSVIRKMNDALQHRGPDAEGIYTSDLIALGHRRLSILDLDERSNQPMSSSDGRYTIVYNGEIYNYQDIRNELSEFQFNTGSDTEVLLYAHMKWGADCLKRLEGMFAFAIWDEERKELFIARDRIGIKPLYYHNGKQFVFSSEIRSILASELVTRQLDDQSLSDYLLYLTVHAPYTILKDVFVLMPGTYLRIMNDHHEVHTYWSANEIPTRYGLSREEAMKQIRNQFSDAVRKRLVADVPFGAFLSGGIDSSAVVAMMAEHMDQPVRTFHIGFNESEFSEAPYAKKIAEKFDTRHEEIIMRPVVFRDRLPDALSAMDHPGADGPNTFLVSEAAKQAGVTMALSGLGGDELFAGYPFFHQLPSLDDRRWVLSFPRFMRSMAGLGIKAVKGGAQGWKTADLLVQDYWDLEHTYRFSRMTMPEKEIDDLIRTDHSFVNRVYNIVKDACGVDTPGYRFDAIGRISVAEMLTYLPNVLLRDTDQMSMAHNLEVRVPFLDHKLVELALALPGSMKVGHKWNKGLFVESLGDLLPPEIVDRPKMGFTFPWKDWLRNDLREFASERLDALSDRPNFNRTGIEKRWDRFQQGKTNDWAVMWNMIVLENYLDQHGIS